MVIKIFKIAAVNNSCLNNKKVSNPNVEKVLKPPQNPVSRSNLMFELKTILDELTHIISAKIKQALIFEIKVAQGRDKEDF